MIPNNPTTLRTSATLTKLAAFGLLMGLALTSVCEAQDGNRWEVPGKKEVRNAKKQIQTKFAQQFNVKTVAEGTELANLLIEQAEATNGNLAARFALLDFALEAAVNIPDVEIARNAFSIIVSEFDVDTKTERFDLINKLARNLTDWIALQELILAFQPDVDSFIQSNQYDDASKLLRALSGVAKRAGNPAAAKLLEPKIKHCKFLSKEYDKSLEALAALELDSGDPPSNAIIGDFFCLTKGEFERGLEYLAKGPRDQHKTKAAFFELSNDLETDEAKLNLANLWWSAAEENDNNLFLLDRSASYYKKVVKNAVGLSKKQIESRIKTITQLKTQSAFGTMEFFGIAWRFQWSGSDIWDKAVFEPGGTVAIDRGGTLNDSGTYPWQQEKDGAIRVITPVRHYVIRQNLKGSLSGTKYDPKTQKKMSSADGTRLK